MGALKSRGPTRTRGPVPGTVEIASHCEVDTSAAVPGTDKKNLSSRARFNGSSREISRGPRHGPSGLGGIPCTLHPFHSGRVVGRVHTLHAGRVGFSNFEFPPHNGCMGPANYRDRSTGLIVFGVVEILIGAIAALLVPLMVLVLLASRSLDGGQGSMDLATALPSMVIYAVAAVFFIAVGIGSITARRWARALMLSLSWLGLITGIMTMVVLCLVIVQYFGVSMFAGLPELALILAVLAIIGFFYVALPLAFVLFYRSEDVAATCRARDPNPSWLDDTQPQIVSLVLVYVLGLASVLLMPAYHFIFPLFGTILDGWTGAGAWLVVAVLLCYLILATVRSDPPGWRVAMTASVVAALSWTVTAAVVPYARWLEHMELPPAQSDLMVGLGAPSGIAMVLLSVFVWASWIAYLVYIRTFLLDRAG